MSEKADILVLGATGYTGRLITRYLVAHPQWPQFTLAIGARSTQKLGKLVEDLNLPSSVKLVHVDVTRPLEVEAAVRVARVVINTVGPYWLWGTPVVRSCVRHGVHYVDLTGETAWAKQIITEFDYFATKTGSIIVPSCGFDSIPSDISAHLANKTLKSIGSSLTGEYLNLGASTSAFSFYGGISGGTIASAMTAIERVPRRVVKQSRLPYVLSPYVGLAPRFRLLYSLPVPGSKTIKGGIFVMGAGNRALVQRTFGLLEMQNRGKADEKKYGPDFCYDEFQATSGTLSAWFLTTALIVGFTALLIKPLRLIAKKFLPQSGDGPSDEFMQKGFFGVTNVTTSTSTPPVNVKTVIKGKGDPGYLLTAIMISESALCFLLPPVSETSTSTSRPRNNNIHALPALAQEGGILTPMTAFGDVLIQRLEETGRFEFSSSILVDDGAKKLV
ncbi:hypothetical protein M413DRAFT_446577 [Hebeloma cylindrosporum]|uniref:Saccharopine dehydrogenase NADP binding domain-containing protein n=1 Tax=Hebeloma cylindrosporum TaxID=76867 RepID=A0A0C3C9X2_HEBCY|nr:hypothetical protein M413DRAFT_446577 [Hebeloma cylindrosporum h7]